MEASRRLSSSAARGVPTHVLTLDVANLDQLRLDPLARMERVRLVLLHTKFPMQGPPSHSA